MELERAVRNAARQADFEPRRLRPTPNDYDIRIDIFCKLQPNSDRSDSGGKSYHGKFSGRRQKADFGCSISGQEFSYYLGGRDYSSQGLRTSLCEKAQVTLAAVRKAAVPARLRTYEAASVDYNYAASVIYHLPAETNTPDASLYNTARALQIKGRRL